MAAGQCATLLGCGCSALIAAAPTVCRSCRDRKSRALLVHLCSFGGSQDPIASATCFQSAPNSLDHGKLFVRLSGSAVAPVGGYTP